MQKKSYSNHLNNMVEKDNLVCSTNQKGITLIALIITIIVMLILVAVAVRAAVNSGLFGHAKNATQKWADEQRKETNIGNGPIEIGGKTYDSIDDYLDEIKEGDLPPKHPDQSAENNDIGIGTDGKPVNLDLWRYTLQEDQTYRLSSNEYYDKWATYVGYKSGYIGPITETGEIIGTVPQYIINSETGMALPITSLNSTFNFRDDIIKAPLLPEGIRNTNNMFQNCTKLSTVELPNDFETIGENMFRDCRNLNNFVIPDSVTSIGDYAFFDCTSLSSINIPNNVTTMGDRVFAHWTELQTINCQSSEKTSGWHEKWSNYNYSIPCEATVNWGVSM